MPYISQDQRDTLIDGITWSLWEEFPRLKSGELNFLITKILLATHPKSYEDFNRLIGVLECVKMEFYRKKITIYENEKEKINGPVY